MHLSPEAEQRMEDLVRVKTPRKYQMDVPFLCTLISNTFKALSDLEQVERQLLTELKTYFEAETAEVVTGILQELSAKPPTTEAVPTKRSSDANETPLPEKRAKVDSGRLEMSKTNLYLRKIPKELNSIEQINSHFKQFGDILNVQVYPNKNSAQICFATEEAAQAALQTKEPVLGNRYILIAPFRSKKKYAQVTEPVVSPQVQVKQVARELKFRKKQLSKEKTDLIQSLLKVLNERSEELSAEEQKALLEQIRTLGMSEGQE